MKFKLHHYDKKFCINHERDDLTSDEALEIFVTLLVCAGYTLEAIIKSMRVYSNEYEEDKNEN